MPLSFQHWKNLMSNASPTYVFVHGAWHDAATWRLVTRCLNDKTIPIAAQDFMIGAIDERAYGPTHTHSLVTSHSPFCARLRSALADIPMEIAGKANWRVEARQKARA